MRALCRREVRRQMLPIDEAKQLEVFESFAIEVESGEKGSTELLDLCIENTSPDLEPDDRRELVEKLKSHPLMHWTPKADEWRFKEEQIGIVLLGLKIVELGVSSLGHLASRLKLDAGIVGDLASIIIQLLAVSDESGRVSQLSGILKGLEQPSDGRESDVAARLRGALLLRAVDQLKPQGSLRSERSAAAQRLLAQDDVSQMILSTAISGFDFRGVTFRHCRFEGIVFLNCEFDDQTTFTECQFAMGGSSHRCNGLSLAAFVECRFDTESSAWLRQVAVREGSRDYVEADLRSDIEGVLDKFLAKGGAGLKTLKASNLARGSISASPHREMILEVLRSHLFEAHHVSGVKEGGLAVKPEAQEAVKFYGTNNVFIGPVNDAYERLAKKLRIRTGASLG